MTTEPELSRLAFTQKEDSTPRPRPSGSPKRQLGSRDAGAGRDALVHSGPRRSTPILRDLVDRCRGRDCCRCRRIERPRAGEGVPNPDSGGPPLPECLAGEKLGGYPQWRQVVEVPTCRACSSPMRYLFQIRLTESFHSTSTATGRVGSSSVRPASGAPSVRSADSRCQSRRFHWRSKRFAHKQVRRPIWAAKHVTRSSGESSSDFSFRSLTVHLGCPCRLLRSWSCLDCSLAMTFSVSR